MADFDAAACVRQGKKRPSEVEPSLTVLADCSRVPYGLQWLKFPASDTIESGDGAEKLPKTY